MKNLKKMFFRLLFLVLLFFWTIPSWAQFKSFQLFSHCSRFAISNDYRRF
jgi:hypothetical protein